MSKNPASRENNDIYLAPELDTDRTSSANLSSVLFDPEAMHILKNIGRESTHAGLGNTSDRSGLAPGNSIIPGSLYVAAINGATGDGTAGTQNKVGQDQPARAAGQEVDEKQQRLDESIKQNQDRFMAAGDGVSEVKKRLYNVEARRAAEGEVIFTKEKPDGVPLKNGDWVVTRLNDDGTPAKHDNGMTDTYSMTEKKLKQIFVVPDQVIVDGKGTVPTNTEGPTRRMVQLTEPTTIMTKWGEMTGNAGDFLANYDFDPKTGKPGVEYAVVDARAASVTLEGATEKSAAVFNKQLASVEQLRAPAAKAPSDFLKSAEVKVGDAIQVDGKKAQVAGQIADQSVPKAPLRTVPKAEALQGTAARMNADGTIGTVAVNVGDNFISSKGIGRELPKEGIAEIERVAAELRKAGNAAEADALTEVSRALQGERGPKAQAEAHQGVLLMLEEMGQKPVSPGAESNDPHRASVKEFLAQNQLNSDALMRRIAAAEEKPGQLGSLLSERHSSSNKARGALSAIVTVGTIVTAAGAYYLYNRQQADRQTAPVRASFGSNK